MILGFWHFLLQCFLLLSHQVLRISSYHLCIVFIFPNHADSLLQLATDHFEWRQNYQNQWSTQHRVQPSHSFEVAQPRMGNDEDCLRSRSRVTCRHRKVNATSDHPARAAQYLNSTVFILCRKPHVVKQRWIQTNG